jgi:hypothetical protein
MVITFLSNEKEPLTHEDSASSTRLRCHPLSEKMAYVKKGMKSVMNSGGLFGHAASTHSKRRGVLCQR